MVMGMTGKNAKVAELVRQFEGQNYNAHYLGFFECFNRQLFFEAHEVLEVLWLKKRSDPQELFYKGLIQLAGAFVHVQKGRRGPAIALLKLAQANLSRYPGTHEGLKVSGAMRLIEDWLVDLSKSGEPVAGLTRHLAPHLPPPQPPIS